MERLAGRGLVQGYAKNDHLGLLIPYTYADSPHDYHPDFLVRLPRPGSEPLTLILEVKGQEDERTRQKHAAAQKWVRAVNNWGRLGRWRFEVCYDPVALPAKVEAIGTN